MRFYVNPQRFVLLALPRGRFADIAAACAAAPEGAICNIVVEDGAATAVAPEDALRAFFAEPGARVELGYRIITFTSPMSWDVVGFLALVTRHLAEGGVPLGAICSFDLDHLFVNERHLARARSILRENVCEETERLANC